MPTQSRAKKAEVEEQEPVEEELVEELAPGEGAVEAAPKAGSQGPMYVWPAPGYVVVREMSGQEAGIGGDMAIGEVAIPHPELAAYYPEKLPLLYPSRKTPTIKISGKTYAMVNVEDIMGVASRDQNAIYRFQQGQEAQYERAGYEDRAPEADYRQSSNSSAPGFSTNSASGSASPFDTYGG